jgi:glutamate--cysteine ligase
MSAAQVKSFVEFLEAGIKPSGTEKFGVEIEHPVVYGDTKKAVSYFDQYGTVYILNKLSPFFNETVYSGPNLIGLNGDHIEISLEPGAQLECSLGPFDTSSEVLDKYNWFRGLLDHIFDELKAHGGPEIEVLNIGYQPATLKDDIQLNPKPRYAAMNEHLSKSGKYGQNMMRCSASTQVSIDFFSEEDMIKKMRVGNALGPILCMKYANTPFFEGEKNSFNMLRVEMWDNLDSMRCGTIPGVFDDDFGFESYAKWLVNHPLMVADFTHTPERIAAENGEEANLLQPDSSSGKWPTSLVQMASEDSDTASNLYPDRALNKFEIEHIISVNFPDVRLKNFVELRTCDSMDIDNVIQYVEDVKRVFYNQEKLDEIAKLLNLTTSESIGADDIVASKAALQSADFSHLPVGVPHTPSAVQHAGDNADPVLYGIPYSKWLELIEQP